MQESQFPQNGNAATLKTAAGAGRNILQTKMHECRKQRAAPGIIP
jgi:hypothetical protein